VVRSLAKALASQGYLVYSPTKTPSLQLVFTWGCMTSGTAKNQLITLVSGETLPNTDDDPVSTWSRTAEHQRILADADDERYFVMITAYDQAASVDRKQQILLWEARHERADERSFVLRRGPAYAAPHRRDSFRPRDFAALPGESSTGCQPG